MLSYVLLKNLVDLMKEIVIMTMNVNLDSNVEQTIVLYIFFIILPLIVVTNRMNVMLLKIW